MRCPPATVRSRAALGTTAVVAVALVAAGLAVLLSLRANLTDQAERQADDTARTVALTVASRTPDAALYARLPLPDDDDRPVQVTTEDGRVLAVSKDLERISGTGTDAVRPRPTGPASAARSGGPANDGHSDHGDASDESNESDGGDGGDDHEGDDDRGGRSGGEGEPAVGRISDDIDHDSGRATVDGDTADYRFATVGVTDRDGRTVRVHAGASLAARGSAVGTAAAAMLAGGPVLLAVVWAVTWLVTRSAFAPVEGIRREMAAITASGDLSRRVPQPATRDEVARLARTTNETLTALEAAVERRRRFVADASHELRSPIASLRTQLEVGSAHPQLLDVDGAVEDAVRLQRLAADLLLLARLDSGERPAGARFDLAALVREELGQRTGDRLPAVFGGDAPPAAEVAGSRTQLARVLGNLVDNAQRHARTRVEVSLRREAEGLLLTVADDGAGVRPEDRERIFERFVRLDEARGRDDGDAGLGLAIARDVAARHGGRLTAGAGGAGGAGARAEPGGAEREPRGG
ncbi:sensor histidine kinase [Streptomyces sp. 8L]|uniref:sensor histidine kinase n=1 Tax=Streptomyces sp. 8L TaxID=2877242 RepID=UPI001CD55F70|nr:HAMP domain-containing sensor histidine kinase [Streptomyces sp. 8L]MCA1217977.1 HAMP domain-containing histidine kinase [Streptomyces sp. 8L]